MTKFATDNFTKLKIFAFMVTVALVFFYDYIPKRTLKINSYHYIIEQQVTASIGVAKMSNTTSFEEIFQQADEALYKAKGTGRNKSVVYHHE